MVGDRGGAGSPDYVSLQPVSADVLADDIVQRFDSTGMFHYCCPRPIEDCLIVSHRSISWSFVFDDIASEYDAI